MEKIASLIGKKDSIVNVFLLANIFIWYSIAFKTITNSLQLINASCSDTLLIMGVNAGAITVSLLIGSFIGSNFKKRINFIYIWIITGIPISLLPICLGSPTLWSTIFAALLFGCYFGIGLPNALNHFSFLTNTKNRGKNSGFTYLLIGVFSVLCVFLIPTLAIGFVVLAFVRLIALFFFFPLRKNLKITNEQVEVTYRSILSNKSFFMYFIPWLIFSLVNYMTIPIVESNFSGVEYENFIRIAPVLEAIIIALVAVVSGFFADTIGR
ncbi:MAG: hypothetical protein GX638_11325, partial [Crenarchaeota archaeon]|nr:hypothetical protein [Thermoproteota archaeon]